MSLHFVSFSGWATYIETVRWIAAAAVSVLVVVLGLIYLRGELRSEECGGGFGCPAYHALNAEISEDCRVRGLGVLAREFGTALDPYAVSWAYSRKQRAATDEAYWSCLDGLGISAKAWAYWEPPAE